jgi:hypothetical protein
MTDWVYMHRDLDQPPYPDGSPVLRPAVAVVVSSSLPAVLGVLDFGSPASVADATLFIWSASTSSTTRRRTRFR